MVMYKISNLPLSKSRSKMFVFAKHSWIDGHRTPQNMTSSSALAENRYFIII